MKTFDELEFEPHPILKGMDKLKESDPELYNKYRDSIQARLKFNNGWEISVVQGYLFYSDSDTYEIGFFHNDIMEEPPFHDDIVLGHQTPEQITEIMKQLQEL